MRTLLLYVELGQRTFFDNVVRVAAGAGVGYSLTLIFVAMLQTRNNCTDCESEAESKMYVCPF